MTGKPHKLTKFFREVWRRHVLQVALPYCVGGWLVIEVSEVVLEAFEAPGGVLRAILLVFLIGLPVVIALAWIFDFTPAGVVRTRSADTAAEEEPEPAPAMSLSLGESERRQVTMLSCAFDFYGGDNREQDPEFLRDSINALDSLCKDIAARFNGYRLRRSAENLTLVFGYPTAGDDDVRRAVAAGLALVEAADSMDENHDGRPDLTVRIGIHTGLVVVDAAQDGERDVTIVGQVPRIVDWLQTIAPANAVVISQQARDLIARFWASESLGKFSQAQLGGRVEVFQVLADAPPAPAKQPPQQVGRDAELTQLQSRWQHTLDGDGQFVLIRGEPGIGKSTLVQAFQQAIEDTGSALVLQVFCSPYEQNTALYPIVQALRGPILGFASGDGQASRLATLHSFVEQRAAGIAHAEALLANLLSLPLPAGAAALSGSPQHIRSQTLQLLLHIIRQQAESRPFLLIIEDLLFADPTTLEWIHMMVGEGPSRGVFLLLTARPSFTADWTRRSYVMTLDLLPLASRAASELLLQTAGDIKLPAALVAHIIRETGGNPLYVHELTRAVIESGEWNKAAPGNQASDLSWLKIPATLQDSLAARVDHLGPAKALLQLCSVLGREFDYNLLRAVSGTRNEAALKQDLATIVQSELLFQRGSATNPNYSFKHVLIQETAYHSLLKSTRKDLHRHTASVIEKDYPELAQQQPALMAWHYGEAGEGVKAAGLWAQAARLSLQAFANHEAIAQAERGLAIVHSLPPSAQQVGLEIPLQSALGMGLLATRGYAAAEARQAFSRAMELCEKAGDTPQLFRVVVGLWMYYMLRANYARALDLSQTLLRIADASADPAQFLQAHYCVGYTLFYQAEFAAGRAHLETALQSEQAGVDYAVQSASGDDTRSHIRNVLTHLCWHMGEPQKALQYLQEALSIVHDENHPFGIAFITFGAAWFHVARRDAPAALLSAQPAVAVAQENGFEFFQPLAEFMLTWAQGRDSKSGLAPGDGGIATKLQSCLDRYCATGALAGVSFQSFMVAEDLIALGQCDRAEQSLQAAWAHVEQFGELFFAAEYYRLKGKLCLRRNGSAGEAIELFHQAIHTARSHNDVALELRAAIDLARASAAQGQSCDQALDLLTNAMHKIHGRDDSSEAIQAEQVLRAVKKQLHP